MGKEKIVKLKILKTLLNNYAKNGLRKKVVSKFENRI
jgi:hypothetical protein